MDSKQKSIPINKEIVYKNMHRQFIRISLIRCRLVRCSGRSRQGRLSKGQGRKRIKAEVWPSMKWLDPSLEGD